MFQIIMRKTKINNQPSVVTESLKEVAAGAKDFSG